MFIFQNNKNEIKLASNDYKKFPNKIKEIFNYLQQTVVGQDKAKRNMAVAVVNHYKRLMHDDLGKVEKSNLLIVGPTGTGKTHMAKQIAKFC